MLPMSSPEMLTQAVHHELGLAGAAGCAQQRRCAGELGGAVEMEVAFWRLAFRQQKRHLSPTPAGQEIEQS